MAQVHYTSGGAIERSGFGTRERARERKSERATATSTRRQTVVPEYCYASGMRRIGPRKYEHSDIASTRGRNVFEIKCVIRDNVETRVRRSSALRVFAPVYKGLSLIHQCQISISNYCLRTFCRVFEAFVSKSVTRSL